jgi:hypothetical protein
LQVWLRFRLARSPASPSKKTHPFLSSRLWCDAPQPPQQNLRRAQRGGFSRRRRWSLTTCEMPSIGVGTYSLSSKNSSIIGSIFSLWLTKKR